MLHYLLVLYDETLDTLLLFPFSTRRVGSLLSFSSTLSHLHYHLRYIAGSVGACISVEALSKLLALRRVAHEGKNGLAKGITLL